MTHAAVEWGTASRPWAARMSGGCGQGWHCIHLVLAPRGLCPSHPVQQAGGRGAWASTGPFVLPPPTLPMHTQLELLKGVHTGLRASELGLTCLGALCTQLAPALLPQPQPKSPWVTGPGPGLPGWDAHSCSFPEAHLASSTRQILYQ